MPRRLPVAPRQRPRPRRSARPQDRPARRQPRAPSIGLDRQNARNPSRVVLERPPVAASHVDHAPSTPASRRRLSSRATGSGLRSSRRSRCLAKSDCRGPYSGAAVVRTELAPGPVSRPPTLRAVASAARAPATTRATISAAGTTSCTSAADCPVNGSDSWPRFALNSPMSVAATLGGRPMPGRSRDGRSAASATRAGRAACRRELERERRHHPLAVRDLHRVRRVRRDDSLLPRRVDTHLDAGEKARAEHDALRTERERRRERRDRLRSRPLPGRARRPAASTTCGTSTIVPTQPALPPASHPWATRMSAPASSATAAARRSPTCCIQRAPASWASATRSGRKAHVKRDDCRRGLEDRVEDLAVEGAAGVIDRERPVGELA